jgi:GxxExxY protein
VSEQDIESLARIVIDQGYRLHLDTGPGLLESVYETILSDRLRDLGYRVETQKCIDISMDGRHYANAFRADIIVNNCLLLEIKSVSALQPVHIKQTLTYIRLLKMPLGLLINFGEARFKDGIKRIMNDVAK